MHQRKVRKQKKHVQTTSSEKIPEEKVKETSSSTSLAIEFFILLFPRLLSAIINPMQDCDEVYNYWEPTHLVLYGYGFQTWEYRYLCFYCILIIVHCMHYDLGYMFYFMHFGERLQFYLG